MENKYKSTTRKKISEDLLLYEKKKKKKKKERKGEAISRLRHCIGLKNVWLLRHDVQRHML